MTVTAAGLQALTDGSSYTLTTNVSDAAGNAATENTGTSFTYDKTAPTLAETTAVPTLTNDNSTQYTFSSSEGGTISVGGSCSSDNNTAVADNMTVSFAALADGTYSDCTITVTDSAGNTQTISVNTFTIDTTKTDSCAGNCRNYPDQRQHIKLHLQFHRGRKHYLWCL